MKAIINQLYIHEKSRESPLAQRLICQFKAEAIHFVSEDPTLIRDVSGNGKALYVRPNPGPYIKRCRGFSEAKLQLCCNFHVISIGEQCLNNCSYCLLETIGQNKPYLTLYSDIQRLHQEFKDVLPTYKNSEIVFGIGDVIDPLSFDSLTHHSIDIIKIFKDFPQHKAQFRTRSAQVDHLLNTEHAGNIRINFELNPDVIIQHEEGGTATLSERLEAARKCLQNGLKISFAIDPMIWHPEWKENYGAIADRIASDFSPKEIENITIGSLRVPKEIWPGLVEKASEHSPIKLGINQIAGDSMKRYVPELRLEMHQFMKRKFSKLWKLHNCPLYLLD